MGLRFSKTSAFPVVFRDWGRLMTWPADIEVYVSDTPGDSGQVEVFVHGSSYSGLGSVQRDYVARLVSAFVKRVEHENATPAITEDAQHKKRTHRVVLRCLTVAALTPVELFVPAIWVPIVLWNGQPSKLMPFFVPCICICLTIAPIAGVLRRRLVGTRTGHDGVVLGVCVGLLVALVTGVIVATALGKL
jgi:hypothetical protein